MVTVTLDCAALAWATRHIQTEKQWAEWGRTFVEALATNKAGINDFADNLIAGVHAYRDAKAEEMRNLRGKGASVTDVPEQSNVPEHSPTSSLVLSSLKGDFKEAMKAYKGTKNGLDREWENFLKKNRKDAETIVPLLLPAIEAEKDYKERLLAAGAFCPPWKNFQTWINNACWTQEFGEIPLKGASNGTHRQTRAERLDADAAEVLRRLGS